MSDKKIKAALQSGENRKNLKRVVLVLGGVLIVGFTIWFYLDHRERYVDPSSAGLNTQDIEEKRLYNPKYVSRDKQDRPYTITADVATEDKNGMVNLNHAKMVLEQGPNKFMILKANTARFQNQQLKKAVLEEDVNLTLDDDMTVKTSKASVDFQEGSIDGPNEVSGEGTRGTMKAKRFKVQDNWNILQLYDEPEVVINENK
jgi:lipopolysaccharide export system protein LptC